MKCEICGKEVLENAFCRHCFSYAPTQDRDGKVTMEGKTLAFKRKSTLNAFYSSLKLSISLSVVFTLLTAAFEGVFFFHVYSQSHRIATMQQVLFIVIPITLFVVGLMSVVKNSLSFSRCKKILDKDFVIFRKLDAPNNYYLLNDGVVYKSVLGDAFDLKRVNDGNVLYYNDKECVIDVDDLRATLKAEADNVSD